MKLLIDLGNTRLKAAIAGAGRFERLDAVTHAGSLDHVDFAAMWTDVPAPDSIWVASVAGLALEQRIGDGLRHRFGIEPVFVRSRAAACGVTSAYAEPERLGVDRFLGLVALRASEPGACVLAGCGTALTLDALAADGTHLGGLIGASPMLAVDALTGATARLRAPRDARIVDFADNTADAIESGAWLAAAALTERFVARTAARLQAPVGLVLGGGGAERLGSTLAIAHRVEPDIVLHGLARFAAATS